MQRRFVVMLLGVGLLTVAVGADRVRSGLQTAVTPPAANAGITADVLASTQPSNAPGQELAIRQVTFDPGGGLVPHTHPGTQLIWLESGTLHLVVVEGEAPIVRAASAATPGPTDVLTSGQETDLGPGDSWVEAEGVVHYAVNTGAEPAVIRVATLYRTGEPASHSVEMAATPTS
jgi:quercetin dioxygenase-like cupin family protein